MRFRFLILILIAASSYAADLRTLPDLVAVSPADVNYESARRGAAVMPDGGFRAVYSQDVFNGYGTVYLRRFDASAAQVGATLELTTAGELPSIANDAGGNSVVVWTAAEGNGTTGIYATRVTSGDAQTGGVIHVNTYTAGEQSWPSVAVAPGGDFIVVWQSADQDGSGFGIYAQRFTALGVPTGSEFKVNTTTANSQKFPAVAMHSDGSFIVVWTRTSPTEYPIGIDAQRYDAGGTPIGGEFTIDNNSATTPDVAFDPNGGFIVAWVRNDNGGGTWYRRFTAAGAANGAAVQFLGYLSGGFYTVPSVAIHPGGAFVVTWSWASNRIYTMYAQRVAPSGQALERITDIDPQAEEQDGPATVVFRANGEYSVVWNKRSTYTPMHVVAQRQVGFPKNDLDGDRTGDILLEHSGGLPAVWLMNNFTIEKGGLVDEHPLAAGEHVRGAGYFNADSKQDFIVVNDSTGRVAAWMMDGTEFTSDVTLGHTGSADWRLRAVADLNTDGFSDLVFQHVTTGQVWFWMINNGAVQTAWAMAPIPVEWEIRGSGDFDDVFGNDDLILQNRNTGQIALWLMEGMTIRVGGVFAQVPTSWQVRTVGDLNGDGKSDVILQNEANGQIAIWLMDGLTIKVGAVIHSLPLSWRIRGSTDFNADGRDDLVLFNSATGDIAVWGMNGIHITYGAILATMPPGWSLAMQP